jgi:hypothetical protein
MVVVDEIDVEVRKVEVENAEEFESAINDTVAPQSTKRARRTCAIQENANNAKSDVQRTRHLLQHISGNEK